MFKLEQAIANWRRQQAGGGTCSPEVLDELESHLDEEIRRLVAEGISEAGLRFRFQSERVWVPSRQL